VFGLGWGDEGKGKLVDLLAAGHDVVVRYNGGANAGHTVQVGAVKFALHLLPIGVLHAHAVGVIGPGVVVDPGVVAGELDELQRRGIEVGQRLKISARAHLVLPHHKVEDALNERALGEGVQIGTTGRGIGPCYADKMRRSTAVRVGDLVSEPGLAERVRTLVEQRRAMLRAMYGDAGGLEAAGVLTELDATRDRLAPYICDTTAYLREAVEAGRSLLYEGANGLLLDVNHGTYPYVTSSHTGPHGVAAGAGVPPAWVEYSVGVIKAYATRVGGGPFVTELHDATAERIRQRGREYGTTTGRPRRCGWFDAVATRYSVQLAGPDAIAVMHLDTLSGLERIGICTAYRIDGRTVTAFPGDSGLLARAEPVLEYVPGWTEELGDLRRFEDLPASAARYVERLEALLGKPVALASVGPERAQVLARGALRWAGAGGTAGKAD